MTRPSKLKSNLVVSTILQATIALQSACYASATADGSGTTALTGQTNWNWATISTSTGIEATSSISSTQGSDEFSTDSTSVGESTVDSATATVDSGNVSTDAGSSESSVGPATADTGSDSTDDDVASTETVADGTGTDSDETTASEETGEDGSNEGIETTDSSTTDGSTTDDSTTNSDVGDEEHDSTTGLTCDPGLLLCDEDCIDPLNDELYCGARDDCEGLDSGQRCRDNESCIEGDCQLICPAPRVRCGDECIDPETDERYCGVDSNCEGGERCPAQVECNARTCQTKDQDPFELAWSRTWGTSKDEIFTSMVVEGNGSSLAGLAMPRGDSRLDRIADSQFALVRYSADGIPSFLGAWGELDNDEPAAGARGSTGEIYLGGSTRAPATNADTDALVQRIGAAGSLDWAFRWGGEGEQALSGMAVLDHRAILVTGHHQFSKPDRDILFATLKPDRELTLSMSWGSSHDDIGLVVMTTDDNRVYVAGITKGQLGDTENAGGWDIFVAQVNLLGERAWVRQWGSSEDDYVYALAVDSTGSVALVGETRGDVLGTGHSGGSDMFAAHVSDNGRVQWSRQWGSGVDDKLAGVVFTEDDRLMVAGETRGTLASASQLGTGEAIVAELDGDGRVVWSRQWGSGGYDHVAALAQASNGDLYVAGYTSGDHPDSSNQGGADGFVSRWRLKTRQPED